MHLGRMGLLCGMMVLAVAVPPKANAASAKESVNILLTEERQLQDQVKEVYKQVVDVNQKLKSLENQKPANERTLKYSILYLPFVMASPTLVWSWDGGKWAEQERQSALREQWMREKERLHTKGKLLRGKLRTLSHKISSVTGVPFQEGSVEHLDLEKLAGFFAWPVPNAKEISSDYGWRNINGNVEYHTGIDVAANLGDPILASADGVVLFAGPAQGFGNWIVIRHDQGLMTIYGHMYRSGIQVKPGQKVRKGDLIGHVGAAGESNGPHLHYAVATGMQGNSMVTVNPWSFLEYIE